MATFTDFGNSSGKSSKESSKKLMYSGHSLSCPQTPTDDGCYSRGKSFDSNYIKKDVKEKGFQFRDAFHYYAEEIDITSRDNEKDLPQFTDQHQKIITKGDQHSLYKTKSHSQTSELMAVLNTDCSYIKNYKVVGVCDGIIVASDAVIQQLVAIKVIVKPANDCGRRPFFPMGIPYMVPLIRFHETSNCIFLVLKYIRKKNLYWNFTQTVRQVDKDSGNGDCGYHGYKLLPSERASVLTGTLNGVALSSSVNDISDLVASNDDLSVALAASCTCAVAGLDDGDTTLSDVSSDALSDSSEFCERNENAKKISSPCKESELIDPMDDNNKSKTQRFDLPEDICELNNSTNENEDLFSPTSPTVFNNVVQKDSANLTKPNSYYNPDDRLCQRSENKKPETQNGHKSNSHSVSLSIQDMIRNSRELLNKVTKTLESSNSLDAMSEATSIRACSLHRSRSSRRSESSMNLIHNTNLRSKGYNLFNKSVSFDTSEIRTSSGPSDDIAAGIASENAVKVWVSQVIVALDSLHNQGIIWGNFNPSNVLFDENDRVLLTYKCFLPTDWVDKTSHGRISSDKRTMLESYSAPELRNPLYRPTRASDWWSVGALLYQLLTGLMIGDVHPTGVTKHTDLHVPNGLSIHARLLLTHILRADPKDRLGYDGASDLKNHPFFEGITWPEDIT